MTSGMPIIMLTARGYHLEPHDTETSGILRLLSKPFSPRNLLITVQEVLEKHPLDGSGQRIEQLRLLMTDSACIKSRGTLNGDIRSGLRSACRCRRDAGKSRRLASAKPASFSSLGRRDGNVPGTIRHADPFFLRYVLPAFRLSEPVERAPQAAWQRCEHSRPPRIARALCWRRCPASRSATLREHLLLAGSASCAAKQ